MTLTDVWDRTLDRFRSGVCDLRGRPTRPIAAWWTEAGREADRLDQKRREEKEAKRQARENARHVARMERYVQKHRCWFPSDGPP